MWLGIIINPVVFLVSLVPVQSVSACWMDEWMKIDEIVANGAICKQIQQHGNMVKSMTIGKKIERENEQMNMTFIVV